MGQIVNGTVASTCCGTPRQALAEASGLHIDADAVEEKERLGQAKKRRGG